MKTNENPAMVAICWEGFMAQSDGAALKANPYDRKQETDKAAFWITGWVDASNGLAKPRMAVEAYWIVDDALQNAGGREGFAVFYGCPHMAVGVQKTEHVLLREALASISMDEPVYRVKLARRHGKHTVTLLRQPETSLALSQ